MMQHSLLISYDGLRRRGDHRSSASDPTGSEAFSSNSLYFAFGDVLMRCMSTGRAMLAPTMAFVPASPFSPGGNVINLRMASETSQRDVVLSEQSESKDLRIYRHRSGQFGAKIFRLRFAPLKMTRSF